MVSRDKPSPAQLQKARRKDLFHAHGILTLALGWRQTGFSETQRIFQRDDVSITLTHRITEDFGNLVRRVQVMSFPKGLSLLLPHRSDWVEDFTESWPSLVAKALQQPRHPGNLP